MHTQGDQQQVDQLSPCDAQVPRGFLKYFGIFRYGNKFPLQKRVNRMKFKYHLIKILQAQLLDHRVGRLGELLGHASVQEQYPAEAKENRGFDKGLGATIRRLKNRSSRRGSTCTLCNTN